MSGSIKVVAHVARTEKSLISSLSHSVSSRQISTKKTVIYHICTEEIVDSDGHKKGHDSVFRGGVCQEWLHRLCTPVSKIACQAISTFGNPFYCRQCIIAWQSKEISDLRESVQALSYDLKALKNNLILQVSTSRPQSGLLLLRRLLLWTTSHPPTHSSSSSITLDWKYNVVIFRVSESPQGMPRYTRNLHGCTESLKRLLFSQSYTKILIAGALFVTVSVLGGTVVIVLVLGQYWLVRLDGDHAKKRAVSDRNLAR